MARVMALLALAALLIVRTPPTFAAEQGQTQAGGSPASAKHTPSKPKKKATKVPKVKAPAAKPVQPPPAVAPIPAKPAPVNPGGDKPAADKSGDTRPIETKAVPHFASLRAEKVYLRSGPSADFPIQWVFVRKGLPVEILATFDIWRKIRDSEGTIGWVNQQMLTGRRSVLVAGATRDMHGDANDTSEVIAQLEAGVVASVSKCDPDWCEVKAGGYKGWLKRDQVWGLEAEEVIQ